jgi:hypothetical protein
MKDAKSLQLEVLAAVPDGERVAPLFADDGVGSCRSFTRSGSNLATKAAGPSQLRSFAAAVLPRSATEAASGAGAPPGGTLARTATMTSRKIWPWLFRRIGRHRATGRQRDEVYDAGKTQGVDIVIAEDVDT